nr:LuxR family transcriptional regulator [Streptomyces sp. Xyl84]
MLTALGLADEEDAVYRVLVAHPGVRAAELTRTLTAAPADATRAVAWSEHGVADVLHRLVSTGLALADTASGEEPRYRATPPALALEPLLSARRDGLRQAERLIAWLTEQYQEAQSSQPGAPVEVVSGREAVRHRFLQLQLAAHHEVLGLMMPVSRRRNAVVPVEENDAEAEAMRRGVRYRVVLERAWLDEPGIGGLVEESLRAGQELTVVDSVPVQLAIADGKIAMVRLSLMPGSRDPGALIIHETGLLEALVALFHAYRERGWRLVGPEQTGPVPDPEAGPDEVDRSILGLLHVGLTDVSIARQLGLGHRTVQRRLSRLMQLADARTRFQLGCQAVRAGWLSGDDATSAPAPNPVAEDTGSPQPAEPRT